VTELQTKMLLFIGMGMLALLPAAQADISNQRTVLTFSGPVEMPGQILPAGTYIFKLANSLSNRNVVQVFSEDEKRVVGTFLAIPHYRLRRSDKTIITFDERAAGSPQAVRAWFYPGNPRGHEFVYPKTEALALAKANNTPVPAMPEELVAEATKPVVTSQFMAMIMTVPLKVEEPDGEEVELAQADAPSAPAAAELPKELPATASPLPLIGLVGLLLVGIGIEMRIAASRAK
jgi:hypothetical protein